MSSFYVPISFDLTGQVPSFSDPLRIAAWVFAPSELNPHAVPVVLVCLPGGSYTKAYYHLEVPGFTPDDYSFALHMVKQGFLVVAVDMLGVGESSQPSDGKELSIGVLAQAHAAMTRQVCSRLADGTLVTGVAFHQEPVLVGVGHSLGAYVLVAQQADEGSFSAIVPLGYTNKEPDMVAIAKRWAETLGVPFDNQSTVPEILAKMYQFGEHGYIQTDREIAHAFFYAADVPTSLIEADDALATHFPAGTMPDIADPYYMLTKAAGVEVPIFLCNGEVDISANFRAEAATYPLAHDITLFQLTGSGHCHNFASTRVLLWNRLAHWIREIAQGV
jgi:pimeloyl-ACP methyl ester carboxylesterase